MKTTYTTSPPRSWATSWLNGSATWLVLISSLVIGSLVGSCGARSEEATDTKTNWLSKCSEDSDCGTGLSCLCGVCTLDCENSAQCSGLAQAAACFPTTSCGEVQAVCGLEAAGPDVSNSGGDDAAVGSDTTVEETTSEQAGGAEGTPTEDSTTTDSQSTTGEGPADTTSTTMVDTTADASTDTTAEEPTCPRPPEEYSFVGDECELVDFDCANAFYDECGCGCEAVDEQEQQCRPDDLYSFSPDECEFLNIDCIEGYRAFSDECGCGCEPASATETDCRPDDEYAFRGDICGDIDCIEGYRVFTDDCGCGCEPAPPECVDSNRSYIEQDPQLCTLIDFICEDGDLQFTDECGCGCEALQPSVCDATGKEYQFESPEECTVALFECDAGYQPFTDDCGCGCIVTVEVEPTDECPLPEGDALEADVVRAEQCFSGGFQSQEITTEEQFQALMDQCGGLSDYEPPFDTKRVFAVAVSDRPEISYLYAVAATDGVHIGIEAPAYCGGAAPPTSMMVIELSNAPADAPLMSDICYTGECTGLPLP